MENNWSSGREEALHRSMSTRYSELGAPSVLSLSKPGDKAAVSDSTARPVTRSPINWAAPVTTTHRERERQGNEVDLLG